MTKRLIQIIVIWMVGIQSIQAETHPVTLTGKILDSELAIPLEGVQIFLPELKTGAISNEFGIFVLTPLQEGTYKLQISSLGYETTELEVEVSADNNSMLTVKLIPKPFDISEVVISDANITRALKQIRALDLKLRPINSSQDVLRSVPGLFIGQHAGGGKAEQIFLRGFDIDHGTDINISVDGLPVNMVSHAHGQGYADLHFLIPETIERVDFGKGPYDSDVGDFATAGHVAFRTLRAPKANQVKIEAGQFNTLRLLGIANLIPESSRHHAYVAAEYLGSDGPFESPQNFGRINLFAKYTGQLSPNRRFTVSASTFQSQWDASGQIPVRAIEQGMISRFGAIDDTEGGKTSRSNLNVSLATVQKNGSLVRQQLYFSDYSFLLYSNFTFFLEDSVNGDQIRQSERRSIYGYRASWEQSYRVGKISMFTQIGGSLRIDDIRDNELSHTKNRTDVLEYLSFGQVGEKQASGFVDHKIQLSSAFSLQAGLRLDAFQFQYEDELTEAYDPQVASKAIVSPKLRLSWQISPAFQLYSYSGTGFHSNDARVILSNRSRDILPRAYGTDLGIIWKPIRGMIIQSALWGLWLDQEFVYVGDAGIVEIGGKTRRIGGDFSIRYQITPTLYADVDVNHSYARATEEEVDEQYIPLAPAWTSIGGLVFKHPKGFEASLRYRFLGDRSANEDYSLTADGYQLLDAVAQWNFPTFQIGVRAENILNSEWREAQFETESRLRNENKPVSEIHFTPGTPFSARAFVNFLFR